MSQFHPRSSWTTVARPKGKLVALDADQLVGVAVHWTGSKTALGSNPTVEQTAALLRGEQKFHTDPEPAGRGWSDIAYCLPESVEALTDRGWLTHDQITPGDRIYTLNRDTGLGEWQHPEAINVFTGPRTMLQDWRGVLSTPNHRWPVHRSRTGRYELLESTELRKFHQVPVCAQSADQPADAKYTDDFVALVAWFWTEGRIVVSRGRQARGAALYQSHAVNPQNVADIAATLTRLYGPESSHLRDQDRTECPRGHALTEGNLYRRPTGKAQCRTCWLAQSRDSLPPLDLTPRWSTRRTGRKTTFYLNATIGEQLQQVAEAPDKVVRRDFLLALTPAQLDLFIRVSVLADGHRPVHSGPNLAQKVLERSDAFAFACILAGHAVTYGTAPTPQGRTMHTVSMLKRRTVAPALKGLAEVQHDGAVWCPTTPNRTWLARHGGFVFFTGNSAAISQAGHVFDCRGIDVRSAANGDQARNAHYGAVTLLLGQGDVPTAELLQAFGDWYRGVWLAMWPHATRIVGHRDLYSTDCPGDDLYDLIEAGTLAGPPPGKDPDPMAGFTLDQLTRAISTKTMSAEADFRPHDPTSAEPDRTIGPAAALGEILASCRRTEVDNARLEQKLDRLLAATSK